MGGKSKTKTTQNNSVDPWTKSLVEGGRANVRRLQAQNPFRAYEGQRVAGLSDMEQQAQSQFMDGQGFGQGLMAQAANSAMEAGGYRPEEVTAQSFRDADMNAYMNPFVDNVIDANARAINRQTAQTQATNRDDMLSSGAWGGSRSGVVQAETQRIGDDRIADMDARLRSQAFDSAANLFTADANRQLGADTTNANLGLAGAQLGLQGAGLLSQIGGQMDESNRANAGLMSLFGANNRALDQATLDAQYQEFLRRDAAGQRDIATELSLMGMTPIITDSTGTQTTRQTPGIGQIAGLGMQAAALFSDRALKTDIMPDGKIGPHDAYTYRYVWDGPAAPLRRGVMAQEVIRTQPEAVHMDPSGFLKVDYSMLEAA